MQIAGRLWRTCRCCSSPSTPCSTSSVVDEPPPAPAPAPETDTTAKDASKDDDDADAEEEEDDTTADEPAPTGPDPAEVAHRMEDMAANFAKFQKAVAKGGPTAKPALKLREAAQSWTEAYPAMEYRHGPMAIAQPGRLGIQFKIRRQLGQQQLRRSVAGLGGLPRPAQ